MRYFLMKSSNRQTERKHNAFIPGQRFTASRLLQQVSQAVENW